MVKFSIYLNRGVFVMILQEKDPYLNADNERPARPVHDFAQSDQAFDDRLQILCIVYSRP